jgi:hypothetical protein
VFNTNSTNILIVLVYYKKGIKELLYNKGVRKAKQTNTKYGNTANRYCWTYWFKSALWHYYAQ